MQSNMTTKSAMKRSRNKSALRRMVGCFLCALLLASPVTGAYALDKNQII